MSDGSHGTKPLGRIALQRRQVAVNEVDPDATPAHGTARDLVLPGEDMSGDLEAALCEVQGVRAIDLRRVVIQLSVLAHVGRDLARDALILPLAERGDRLFIAMADVGERRAIEELEFISGKQVSAYPAVRGVLRDVIENAYGARAAGATVFRGALANAGEQTRPPAPDAETDALVEHVFVEQREPEAQPTLSEPDPVVAFDDELSRPLIKEVGPMEPLPFDELPPAPAPTAAKQKRKLLIVDDSDDIRRLLVRAFREREYDVIESARGLDALEKVRTCAPDALVLDAMLPEVHGFDICRRIKSSRRYGHIPVVMLSAVYRGWRFAEDLHRSYGVDAFLEKPFRIGEVIAAVDRAIEGRSRSEPPSDGESEAEGLAADHLKAGIEAYNRGDLQAAIEELKKGVAVDPLAFRLHYHLGLLYGKQENLFDAIQALETAADLKPRDFSTLKNLAVLYQRAGFRLKAAEMWERALGSAPDEETRVNIRNHLVSLL